MPLFITTTYAKIKSLTKPIKIIQGGQGASKTFSILQNFHFFAQSNPRSVQTVVSATYPMLKDGPIHDMNNIVTSFRMNFDDLYNKSDKDLIYKNGSMIQFRNLDSRDFHKGKGARRDRLFINEGNRGITWQSIEQMITRSDIDTTIDFNPDAPFWVHDQYLNTQRDDYDFLIVTYKDNEKIPKGELKEIERRIEASKQPGASDGLKNWVRIYAYGELGTYTDRQIYEYNFIDQIPSDAKRIGSGIDFGQSPDPTILVDIWIKDNNIYADEVFCYNNLLPEALQGTERLSFVGALELHKHPKGVATVADTDGRLQIIDARKRGFNIIAVKKSPGFQQQGITKIRGYNLFITRRSANLKKGIESWFWKVDHNGKIIPEPDGHEPDGLAALRYGMMLVR